TGLEPSRRSARQVLDLRGGAEGLDDRHERVRPLLLEELLLRLRLHFVEGQELAPLRLVSLEQVITLLRLDDAAHLTGLEAEHVAIDLLRQSASLDEADEASLRGCRVLRDLPGHRLEGMP